MSNIGRPAGLVGSGGQVPYWGAFPGFPATYGWQFTSAPTTGYVPYWTGSSISWAAPPATLFGVTDQYSYYKTVLGYGAGTTLSATYAVHIGYLAGADSGSSADYSVHVGAYAGYSAGGTGNVCLGYRAGNDYSYTFYNVMIGCNANLASSSNTHSIVIGSGSYTTPFYGKGNYTTLIGELTIDDVWIHGDTFHFGDETAVGDKYWYFTRSSATSGHPGFKWNETTDEIEWSNDGSAWTPLGGGGGSLVGITNTSGGVPAYPERLTALGYEAADSFSLLYQPNTGYVTAIGCRAATAHTTDGYMGTFVGYNAGGGQTAGRFGTFVGAYAGYAGTGINNTAVGYNSLYGAGGSTMANCSALGFSAGWAHALGDNCTYIGSYAGYANYNAVNNVMVGANAGRYITDYSNNVIVGASAAAGGSYKIQQCVIIGSGAGANMTKLTQVYADHVLIGYNAGLGLGINSNSESGIIAIGTSTGYGYNDSGGVYIGNSAGAGFGAGGAAVVGGYNGFQEIYIGYNAGYYGQGGSVNIGIGALALYGKNTGGTGTGNVAIGSSAGQNITDGSYNAIYGTECGLTITTGSNLICIGYGADVAAATDTNGVVIGYGAVGKGSNTTVIGRQAATATTQTWLRGDELRVGNEGATDKFFYFQNSASANQPGLKWNNSAGKIQAAKDGVNYADIPDRIVYDLHKNLATDATGVATVIGADYIDASRWPATRTVKFRCILETTNGTVAATADLFDTADSLATGSPAVVTGSQVTSTALVASMVEATVTAAFAGFTGAGVFEARLWIATTGGGNTATCKSAQLIVEW